MSKRKIVDWLNLKDIDKTMYSLRYAPVIDISRVTLTGNLGSSYTTYKRLSQKWGLTSARHQAHTVESIRPAVQLLRPNYPNAGAEDMRHLLRTKCAIRVSR